MKEKNWGQVDPSCFLQTTAGLDVFKHFFWLNVSFVYDKVSANAISSEPKPSKFQSGQRVVKKVLNT